MVSVGHGSSCGQLQVQPWTMPPIASLVLFQQCVRVSDGHTEYDVDVKALNSTSVLSQAVREACVEGTARVPTNFPVDQIQLWAAYTRMPRVFRTQSNLLNIFATLEVRVSSHVHHSCRLYIARHASVNTIARVYF